MQEVVGVDKWEVAWVNCRGREGQYPGYVFVRDPSSVKGDLLEPYTVKLFPQFIIVSVLGLSRASACPVVYPASRNG